jgi:hypothetical protein
MRTGSGTAAAGVGRAVTRRALAVGLVLVVVACGDRTPDGPPARRAFYYWRTTFQLSDSERRAISELHVDRIYLRMFDLEWNEGERAARAIGKISLADGAQLPARVEIVPVVFVREDVFHHVAAERIGELARTTWADVAQRAGALGFTPRELQLDCDWTDTSHDEFFAFVRALRARAKVALSATIRLHQIKYRERTGVPPVDRGMLMFYNMGRFSADADARAIFDAASAERYLARVDNYPLPLDVALPIWSWTLHVRDERVVGLLQSTDPDELPRVDFLQPAGPDRYVVTRSAFLHGTLLREGDVLKIEVTGPTDTLAAAGMIGPRLAGSPGGRTLSLFDLSERNVTRHGLDQLDHVFRALR